MKRELKVDSSKGETQILLTAEGRRDKIRLRWVRSSMVEQWPFKPLVAGSSPAALTRYVGLLKEAPCIWGF